MTMVARFLPQYPKRVDVTDGLTKSEANGVLTLGFDYVETEFGAELQQAVDSTAADAVSTAADRIAVAADAAAAAASAGEAAVAAQATDPAFKTVADAEAATVAAAKQSLVTSGNFVVGYGGARYIRVASEPTHDGKLRTTDRYLPDGSTSSTNGGWWQIADAELNQFMFGTGGNGDGAGGGVNDATALQAALNTAGALTRPLRFLPSTHRCDSALTVPAGVEITAYGAVIDFTNAGNVAGMTFVNGGLIRGATLIGAGNGAMNAGGKAIACIGTNNSPAAPTFVNAPKVQDCIIDGWAGYGTYFAYTNGGHVIGNNITNIGYTAIGGVSCNDPIAEANLIDGVGPGTVDAYGIFFDREDGTSETSEPRSYRAGILNNIIKNVASVSGNNGQGIDTHGGVDFRIIGNTVLDCEVGIFVTSSVINGVVKLAPKGCVVQGNTIKSKYYVGCAIMVSGAFDGSTIQDYAEGCVVTGNTIEGHGIAGDGTSGAIIAQFTKELVMHSNPVVRPRCNGILLNRDNIGFSVTGHTVVDPFDGTFSVPTCIAVRGNNNRGYIGENALRFEDSTLNTYVAVQSIWVASGLTGLDIEIGRHSFHGIASGRLAYVEETSDGVNAANLMVQRGRVTIPLSNVASVTAAVTTKRFPVVAPHVIVSRRGAPTPGTVGKGATLEYDPASLSATGFNIVARPYDASTFGGSGDLEVEWMATV